MENAGSSPDETLDPTSQLFDPLKALYSDKTKIPVKKAPIYDNITKFESVLKGIAVSIYVYQSLIFFGDFIIFIFIFSRLR